MEDDQRPETQQSDGIELQRPDLRQFTCRYHRDQSWNHHNSADDHQLSAYHQQRPAGSVPFPPEIEPKHADNGRSQESVRTGFKSDSTENDGESISHRVEGGLQVKRFGSGRHVILVGCVTGIWRTILLSSGRSRLNSGYNMVGERLHRVPVQID